MPVTGAAGLLVLKVNTGQSWVKVKDGAGKVVLEKTLSKLAKDLGGLRGRLGNPKFVQSAPEEVIEETRDLLAQKEDEEARVTQALKRLAELA